uniref:von Willebrand factor A domain containing 5B1 n=1 Tax=Seriola dumerili TaxID=41447 RepID=A0A3B4TH31_SERDU
MPGLINKENRSALPLSVSDITSCVRGYTLALTASMTYENIEDHAIEGIFIYPLEEKSIVVGFEAMISSQIITLQIKDKAKIEDCYLDCYNTSNGASKITPGHIVLDEDLEATVLVVNLGIIPPMETVHILVSTSSELSTLPSGGIRVSTPPVCTHTSLWLASLLEEEAINSMDYKFNFQLEIRAPYLLAGVESPSHAIRADADPLARSATSVVITLADKYTYDCPVKILIYPSEPHLPHVLIENGDMTQEEYDEYLHGRSDFIKATKKDSSNERKVSVRLHKDILHNPVVMLNFCPDLKSISSDLRKVHGEFIFLIDRSGSMSGVNINRVKDAMVVILKSLVPGCLFNIIGFGSTFKSLFTTSQNYEEEALAVACEYVRKIRADMGGTNILAPLNWILRQPMSSGHPRLLFLLTDGAVSNTGKVIELVRRHARYIRCFTFGIGQNACRRLVQGLATVSKGTAEFLAEGERLQPKMIKSLKKTMSPVLSDISIEWLFPETKEVLLSPVGNTFLFPGDSLIGYSVVCDTTRYHTNPKSDKRRRYSMMRSIESASSVFYHSQEEDQVKTSVDSQGSYRETASGPLYDSYQDSVIDGLGNTSPRRRAYSTNQIIDYNPAKRVYTPSDPSSVVAKNPLRRAKVQELVGQMSPEHEAQWKNDYQVCTRAAKRNIHMIAFKMICSPLVSENGSAVISDSVCNLMRLHTILNPVIEPVFFKLGKKKTFCCFQPQLASLCATSSRGRPASCHRPLPQQEPLLQQEADSEPQDNPQPSSGGGDCKAVVSGLLCGKPMKWEVVFDIEPFLNGREREEKVHEELWNETFHHLAGHSIIHDFEQMADKECEIEHGSGRKYQLYAIHTSKACNILSKYTAFVPIDLDTNEYLQTCIEYINPGKSYGFNVTRSLHNSLFSPLLKFKNNLEKLLIKIEWCVLHTLNTVIYIRVSCPSVRLALSRTRLLTRAAKGFMCRSHSKSGDSIGESDNENKDYIPLLLLQLASGAFPLDTALCDAINVPMDKLKWTSPFTSHRSPSTAAEPPLSPHSQVDSGRSSGSGGLETASPGGVLKRMLNPESMVWATAVALAWLEHSSASYFIEWELVAAKASMWLSAQDIPEGRDLASIKAAANQLFIILRHWDENLQLNMLCYNPNSV